MPYKHFGIRVKEERKKARMTQEQLAEKAGVSFAFVGHIERGTRKASLDTVVKLANALKVSPNVLLRDSLDNGLWGDDNRMADPDRRIMGVIYESFQEYKREYNLDSPEEEDE